jgi:uncharacterized BrkB/YihY/UPF0761 family membrane protein
MAMASGKRTWGLVRRIYLVAGVLAAVVAIIFLFVPGAETPWLQALIASLILGVALLANDELFDRIHRIFWRREWPK